MFCLDIQPPLWFLFSGEASPLLYYSHFFALISSLVIGFYVYVKNRESLSANLLFAASLFFALWLFLDVLLWVNVDSRIIIFVWSYINLVEVLVSLTTLYFTYTFIEKKDAPMWTKYGFALLLSPLVLLMNSDINVKEFNLVTCEAEPGMLQYYFHFLEALISVWLLGYLAKSIVKSPQKERRKNIIFGLGAVSFLLSFSGTNIVASLTENWSILHYGLFGAPVFAGLLAFLIVRYHAFNVKVLGVQALVMSLSVLIGSQLFFVKDTLSYVLVAITLIAFLGLGIFLIRSVKKEVERKEELQILTDKLAAANQELRRLDNAKSEFISIASHQLRTPLTALRGYISLILEGSYGPVTEEFKGVFDKLTAVNNRMSSLIEDLLSISRIESGRIQYSFAPVDAKELVQEIADTFVPMAKEKNLYLKAAITDKPINLVSMDRNKIREVVSNLVDNAIKYTKEGGVTLALETTATGIRISVKDTGIGVHPEDKKRIFEKFTRSSETMKLDVSGTGLGLYVGKNFIEAHEGTLMLESDGPGRGSCFIIELPFIQKKVATNKK